MTVDVNGDIWASGNFRVNQYDGGTFAELAQISVPGIGLCLAADSAGYIYYGGYGGSPSAISTIVKIDVSTKQPVATMTVALGIRVIVYDGTYLWVTGDTSGVNPALLKINPATMTVIASGIAGINGGSALAMNGNGTKLWFADPLESNLYSVNLSTLQVDFTVFLSGPPYSLLTIPGNRLFVGSQSSVLMLDAISGGSLAPPATIFLLTVGDLAFDGVNVWACNFDGNGVTRIDPSTNTVTGGVVTADGGYRPRSLAVGCRLWVGHETLLLAPGNIALVNVFTNSVDCAPCESSIDWSFGMLEF
jgi:DNA-binding beta-propeller fold protein YncE